VVVALVLGRRDRDHAAGEAALARPCELPDGLVDVFDVDERDAPEPLGGRLAEVDEPVVVRAEARREQREIRHHVELQARGRIDHRAPDPVFLVLAQELGGLIRARPDLGEARGGTEILGVLEALAHLGATLEGIPSGSVDHPPVAVELADHARPPVAEGPVHPFRPQIRWLHDVGIRRDHLPVEHAHLR
jgi:hypothetical protein